MLADVRLIDFLTSVRRKLPLEQIEYILNQWPRASVNDETARHIRGISNDALRKAVVAADHKREFSPKAQH